MSFTVTITARTLVGPQPTPEQTAIDALANKLLAHPDITQEEVTAWKENVHRHLGTAKAPFAVCDIVCRVLRPKLLVDLEMEVEDLLKKVFKVKDPVQLIQQYDDALFNTSLFHLKDSVMKALFKQAIDLIRQSANKSDVECVAIYKELQTVFKELSIKRKLMTQELHAKLDQLQARSEAMMLQTCLRSAEEAERMSQRLQGIGLASNDNATRIYTISERVTK